MIKIYICRPRPPLINNIRVGIFYLLNFWSKFDQAFDWRFIWVHLHNTLHPLHELDLINATVTRDSLYTFLRRKMRDERDVCCVYCTVLYCLTL